MGTKRAVMDHPEPWEVAAAREHGAMDALAMVILVAGALVWALVPSARLVALTGLRLGVAAILAASAALASGVVAQALAFGAHGFLFLALFSVAGHLEAMTLGPIVDRIAGKDAKP